MAVPMAQDWQHVLSGKVVVVMGGTGGLGLSAARAIQAAGGSVVAVGPQATLAAAQAALEPDRAELLSGDARVASTALRAIAAARHRFGRLDGLYHVAGGSGRRAGDGPLHELTDAGIDATVEWNLHSVMYSNRAAVQALLEQGVGGTVLNLTSVLAEHPSRLFATHAYAAAKAAIVGLTRAAASLYAPHNIRFNALAAGLVATPMSERAQADDETMRYIATKQPLDGGRIGVPSDLEAAVVYFLSDLSRFTTGQVVEIDGGWSVTEGHLPEGV